MTRTAADEAAEAHCSNRRSQHGLGSLDLRFLLAFKEHIHPKGEQMDAADTMMVVRFANEDPQH